MLFLKYQSQRGHVPNGVQHDQTFHRWPAVLHTLREIPRLRQDGARRMRTPILRLSSGAFFVGTLVHAEQLLGLALQLSFFEVGTLGGGLVSSAPE